MSFQERRVEEVRRLQVRVEESEEKNKTLNDVNIVLRNQLESAAKTNEELVLDIQKLNREWNQVREEQALKVGENGRAKEKRQRWVCVPDKPAHTSHRFGDLFCQWFLLATGQDSVKPNN